MKSFFTALILIILVTLAGCSGGANNTVISNPAPDKGNQSQLDSLPVVAFDGETAIGLMGAYTLTLSPDTGEFDLVPIRTGDLGESYIVSGKAFFTMAPCSDCLKIANLALDADGNIIVGMKMKHPFQKGDVFKPPSAANRLDLDVFDVALVINPLQATAATYSLTGSNAYPGIVLNATGYTRELEEVTGETAAVPYKIAYENSNNNRFEMGTDYQDFNVVIAPGSGLVFDLYLTMGYGASAKKAQRLIPTYYVPEFNRKSAWKVVVTPPQGVNPPMMGNTWNDMDTTTTYDVTIDIYDWNHGKVIAATYPDPLNTDQISAASDVSSVTVEIPGMTSSLVAAVTTDPSTNGWDDPLTYTASIANQNALPAGNYFGMVKVTDSRVPGVSTIGGETDTLVHTPNGIQLEWKNIPEFATYQIFPATVVIGADPPQIDSINPNKGTIDSVLNNVLISGLNFDPDIVVTLTLSTGGTPQAATNVVVDPLGTSLTCTLDLDSANFILGFYDVTVRNPASNLSDTLLQGFEVKEGLGVTFVNPVQPFNRSTCDDFSPCISQDPNGQLVAFWYANEPTISADIPARSTNGTNWTGGSNVFGTSAPNYRFDVLKIAPRKTSGSFVLINFVYPSLVCLATDYGAYGGGYVFNYPGRTNNLEMAVDNAGYGYGFGDAGGNIAYQKTPSPNTPGNSPAYTVGAGRLSHCRSWGVDSAGLLYLAYLDSGQTQILLSHGTDNTNLTWTAPVTVFQDAAYNEVRDPSVHFVNGIIHMSFMRHNISTGQYELCYTSANVSNLTFSVPVIVDSSTLKFEDAHIQTGTYFGMIAVAIVYEKGDTLTFNFSSDSGASWDVPLTVQTTANKTEDCDMIFMNHTGSITEDIMLIWSETINVGYRQIVTRMGHFTSG